VNVVTLLGEITEPAGPLLLPAPDEDHVVGGLHVVPEAILPKVGGGIEAIRNVQRALHPPLTVFLQHPGMRAHVDVILEKRLVEGPGPEPGMEGVVRMEVRQQQPAPALRRAPAHLPKRGELDVGCLVEVDDVRLRPVVGLEEFAIHGPHEGGATELRQGPQHQLRAEPIDVGTEVVAVHLDAGCFERLTPDQGELFRSEAACIEDPHQGRARIEGTDSSTVPGPLGPVRWTGYNLPTMLAPRS
jgi:hypothetical protein